MMRLIQGDCMKVLPTLPDESVDLIVTDPPYGIKYVSKHSTDPIYRKNVADTTLWDKHFDIKTTPIKEMLRILKPNGHMYVFSRWDCLYDLPKPDRLLIWFKNDYGMGDLDDWSPSYEVILLFKKGKRKLNGKRPQDVLTFHKVANFSVRSNTGLNKMYHPTEKPIRLIEHIIDKASNEGDVILDPFLGSGTTMKACLETKRNCIGIEIEPKYIEICKKRMNWESSLNPNIEWKFEVIE